MLFVFASGLIFTGYCATESNSDSDENSGNNTPEDVNIAPLAENVSIEGTNEVGETLTGVYTYSDEDEDAEGVSLLQWYIAGSEAGEPVAIDGATQSTYEIQPGDAGKYIVFAVIPVAETGTTDGEMLYSEPVYIKQQFTLTFGFTGIGGSDCDNFTGNVDGTEYCEPDAPYSITLNEGDVTIILTDKEGCELGLTGDDASDAGTPTTGTNGSGHDTWEYILNMDSDKAIDMTITAC